MGVRSRRRTRTPASDPPTRRQRRPRWLDLDGSAAERRDWAALPGDVLWVILSLVPQDDILRGAGLVCASWRRVAVDEPLLWRRSAGRCESYRGRVSRRFLLFLACNAPSLRSLHVTSQFDMPSERFTTVVAKKLPLLEQLVMSRGVSYNDSLAALVDHCPRLQLLDAAGCHTFHPIGETLQARLESKIKDLRLPRRRYIGWKIGLLYAPRTGRLHGQPKPVGL